MDWLHFTLRRILRIRVRVNFGTGGALCAAATTLAAAKPVRESFWWPFTMALPLTLLANQAGHPGLNFCRELNLREGICVIA